MRTPFTDRHLSRLVWTVLAVLFLAGCSDDATAPDDPDPEPEGYPFAATEDGAMTNFRSAYDAMDTTVYLDTCLDDTYNFVFTDGSPYAPAGGWDKAVETESATSMFAGNAGYDTVNQTAKLGVQDIDFRTLLRLNAWEDVPLSDPDFPGARKALFDHEIVFILDGGQNTITVAGQQLFYVKGTAETAGGATRTRWRVRGQEDLTAGGKGNENTSWGMVKALYR